MVNPPIPALVIGLGGSGAVTVMHVKEQLLNTYNNELPNTVGLVVFDTSKMPLSQFSQSSAERTEGKGYGKISLDPREFGHIGGNSRKLMERVAADPTSSENRHFSTWLDVDWYLRNLNETLFNLEDGAGQYRQLGRLALFKDVASANNSSFYQRINEKIISISRQAGSDRSLAVFIVGSLVGGTGAGLFLDTAYLVRKIAAAQRMEVQLRGYFYMPDAFRATLDIGQIDNAKPRTFAALRELGRLLINEDYEIGYPVHYQGPSAAASTNIWRSELRTRLYDLVYIVDGTRPNNPMNMIPLGRGTAPSVADAVLAFIDSAAGEYQRSYIVNMSQQIAERRRQFGSVPFVGAVGTYTIMLPIQQIIEKWSYTLGKDILNVVVTPQSFDESTRLPAKLSTEDNQERAIQPDEEVRQLFANRNPVMDPRDTSKQFFPTALWPKLIRWHEDHQMDETRAIRAMSRFDAEEWMSSLEPTSADQSPQARKAQKTIEAIRNRSITTQVQLSHEIKGDARSDHRRIVRDVEKELNIQLGQIKGSGQRDGGIFGDSLGDLSQIQLERFRGLFEVYILRQLNGEDDQNYIRARQGKMGWTMALLSEMYNVFTGVLNLINATRSFSNSNRSDRQARLEAMEAAALDMKDTAENAGGMFAGRSLRQSQEAYRDAAEDVLDLGRAEAARDTVGQLVESMRDLVKSTLDQLNRWTQILATNKKSLYGSVFSGEQQVLSQLNDSRSDYPNRYVINNPQWEKSRYQAYIGAENERIHQALSGLAWTTQFRTNDMGKPTLEVDFTVNNEKLDSSMNGNWDVKNNNMLMAYCRQVFAPAREQESILNYLATNEFKDNERALAEKLYKESGELLGYDTSNTGNTIPNVYLLAHQNDTHADHREYLKRMMNHLRGHYGLPEDDETYARAQSCDDRFRLMMVNMVELLPMNRINIYEDYKGEYMRQREGTRSMLHVFPAEVQSVKYEDRLVRALNQSNRIISDKIAILLEDIDRLRDFLMLMAHGIIKSQRDNKNQKDTHYVYMLTTPAQNPISGNNADVWWLTEPSPEPKLIEAMLTYLFRKKDHGMKKHINGYEFPIDYQWVEKHLLNMRQHQTNENIQAGPDAFFQPVSSWLMEMEPNSPRFLALARTATEYMALEGLHNWMKDQISGALDPEKDKEEYDLYSICVLVINEMLVAKQKDAENIVQS